MCRYFQWGNCHFGMSCRFLHPGVNDYGYGPPPPPQHHSPHYQPPVAPSARAPSTAAAPAPARWPTTEKVWKFTEHHGKIRSGAGGSF